MAVVGCSSTPETAEAATTFDGDVCAYDGSAEFELNTVMTVTFVNTSAGVSSGYGIWKVPDGTTLGDLEAKGIHGVGTDPNADLRGLAAAASPGLDKTLVVTLDTPGTWAINCFHPIRGGADDYPATTFIVRSG